MIHSDKVHTQSSLEEVLLKRFSSGRMVLHLKRDNFSTFSCIIVLEIILGVFLEHQFEFPSSSFLVQVF